MSEPELADARSDGSSEELRARVEELERRVRQAEERRRALLHIMGDLHDSNKRLGEQRKAMLHILKDSNESNLRLEASRKAMIHIMGDLRETTAEMERREHELREKQEQLVQAGKLATLGELTTGVAHELNNPLNNIGLFVGNVIDRIRVAGNLRNSDPKSNRCRRKAGDCGFHIQSQVEISPGLTILTGAGSHGCRGGIENG
jgi:signal transduction histidine kinase